MPEGMKHECVSEHRGDKVKAALRDYGFTVIAMFYGGLMLSGCAGTSRYPDGKVKCVFKEGGFGNFLGNERWINGFCRCYWPTGQIKYVGSFAEGKRTGTHTIYSPNGKIIDQWNYSAKSKQGGRAGVPADGNHVAFWPNGVTRLVETYEKGVLEGARTAWNETGEELGKCIYRNGKPQDGLEFEFSDPTDDDDFLVLRQTSYVKGQKHGPEWEFMSMFRAGRAKRLNWWEFGSRISYCYPDELHSDSDNVFLAKQKKTGDFTVAYSDDGATKNLALNEGDLIPGKSLRIRKFENYMILCGNCPE